MPKKTGVPFSHHGKTEYVGIGADVNLKTRALSIRQPWVEQILRGQKKVEWRSRNTHIRGTVYLYAGMGRYPAKDEIEIQEDVGFEIDDLPRGLIVGTIDVVGCDYNQKKGLYGWELANPKRLKNHLKPTRQPTPAWFYPFESPEE